MRIELLREQNKNLDPHTRMAKELESSLNKVILGKAQLSKMVIASLIAGGHVLLEGLPGLGKTKLCKTLAGLTGLDFKRIQFTPDLHPSDITGSQILEETPEGRRMRFIQGPVFTHFLLADEINRASPKTQAALLESMGEGTVTQMGQMYHLESPFFVIATQNPIELEGTNPLPEAQLDRFAVKIEVPHTTEDALLEIIENPVYQSHGVPEAVIKKDELLAMQNQVDQVYLPKPVAKFIASLISASTPLEEKPEEAWHKYIRFSVSPRGAIWLVRLARALAILDGRKGVGHEDVIEAAPYVMGHRLILNPVARLDSITAYDLIEQMVQHIRKELIPV